MWPPAKENLPYLLNNLHHLCTSEPFTDGVDNIVWWELKLVAGFAVEFVIEVIFIWSEWKLFSVSLDKFIAWKASDWPMITLRFPKTEALWHMRFIDWCGSQSLLERFPTLNAYVMLQFSSTEAGVPKAVMLWEAPQSIRAQHNSGGIWYSIHFFSTQGLQSHSLGAASRWWLSLLRLCA